MRYKTSPKGEIITVKVIIFLLTSNRGGDRSVV